MIRIVTPDSNKKGRVFENFAKKILDGLGYHNFRTKVRKTGREIDILANHRASNEPIICECKAYEKELNGDHLSKFRGIYDVEYDKNKSLVGMLFSLSGFGGGLIEYYNEMDDLVKQRFKIFQDTDIYQFIEKSNLIVSEAVILNTVKKKLQYEIVSQYLSISDFGENWIIIFGIEGKETHFTILSGKGDEVQKYKFDELKKIDKKISNLTPITLNVRTKVILSLCDKKSKKIDEISLEIGESSIDIEMALSNLIQKETILKNEDLYKINDELEAFINLSKEFLSQQYKSEYFRSTYVQSNIDDRLVNHIQNRFYVQFENGQKKAIIKLLQISQSALFQSITHPTEIYKTGFIQISEGSFSEENKKKWMELSILGVMMILTKCLVSDLDSKDSSKILADKNIRGYFLQIKTNFASLNDLYLQLNVESFVMMAKAKDDIEAGQLVSASNLGLFIESGIILTNLKEYDLALKEYNRIIEDTDEPNLLRAAWNNKGYVYAVMKDFSRAIECYNKSIEIDDSIKEPYYNIGKALLFLDKKNEAKEYFEKALEIDNNYEEAIKGLEETRE